MLKEMAEVEMNGVDLFSTETHGTDGLKAVPVVDQGGPAFFEENMRRVTELSNAPNDSSTPYKTMYEAREILKTMETAVVSGKDVPNEEKFDDDTKAWLLARIDHQLGINYSLTEETSAGLRSLKRAMNFILKRPLSLDTTDEREDVIAVACVHEERLPIFGIQAIDSVNHIGVLLSGLAQSELACKYLRFAKRVHKKCKPLVSDPTSAPSASEATASTEAMPPPPNKDKDTSSTSAKSILSLERLREVHTYTLFYLAQAFGLCGDAKNSAYFCRLTLQRQLLYGIMYEPLRWTEHCLSLVDHFLNVRNYNCSFGWLWVAEQVLKTVDPKDYDDDERVPRAIAKCERRKGTFHLNLLHEGYASTVYKITDGKHCDFPLPEPTPHSEVPDEIYKKLGVTTPPPVPQPPPAVQSEKTFKIALEICNTAMRSFKKSQRFFVLEGFVSEYVDMERSKSKMYSNLCLWTEDLKKKIFLHKRRAAILEPVIKELNPEIFVGLIRQMSHELGEIYFELVELKETRLRAKQKAYKWPNLYKFRKVETDNHDRFVMQSNKYYRMFINTFYEKGKPPEKLEEHDLHPYLKSIWTCGRVLSKMNLFAEDPRDRVTWVKKCYTGYQEFIESCKKLKPDSFKKLDGEINVAKDCIGFLPKQIEQLQLGVRFKC